MVLKLCGLGIVRFQVKSHNFKVGMGGGLLNYNHIHYIGVWIETCSYLQKRKYQMNIFRNLIVEQLRGPHSRRNIIKIGLLGAMEPV